MEAQTELFENSTSSQTTKILDHFKAGGTLTPMEALSKFGCFRLGARIWDIKKAGYTIGTESVSKNGKRFARYRLK